jgi:hypothetical protein
MKQRCLNCPSKPTFPDLDSLKEHWSNTHTVPMEHTVAEIVGNMPSILQNLLGDKLKQTIKLTEEVSE